VKRRKNISRTKKTKISEILTDSSHALSQLKPSEARHVAKAQEQLRGELVELRTRFSGMVQRGPVPFVVIDAGGYIREANQAACELLNYPSSKLIYISFTYLVAPKDIDVFKEHLRRCRDAGTEPAITNLRLRTRDRRIVTVQLISNFFHRNGVDHFQTAIVDQTNLEKRAEELADARDFAENIVQTISQPIAVLDDQMNALMVNRAFVRVFAVSPGHGLKTFFGKLLELRIDGETLRQMLRTVLETRQPQEGLRVELLGNAVAPVARGQSGRTLLISARPFVRQTYAKPLLLVSIEDVTKQQEAEATARREQLMLARAEALAHVGGWEWRLSDETLVWSDELYHIFGVDKAKFRPTYKAYLALIHPQDRQRVDATIRKGVNTATPIDFHHRIVRETDMRTLHCQGYVIRDAHGHVSVLIGIAQDVTDLRKAEEQLRAVNSELENRSRSLQRSNEEMQAFSYSIAHDLRAPLRAIQGMSRILMEDYAGVLDEDGQDYFSRIMDAAQRMDDLIRDLLDYARMTTVQLPMGQIDCEAVWARVLSNFDTEVKDKNAVIVKEQPLPTVSGHRTVVELAFSNLLGNALKFFPKDGRPEIRVWTDNLENGCIRFNIQDKGIGIAPEHQQRIFRVFERLHPADAYPGTGIGLAIVKKGIERLGGAVGLASKPGEGSTFWFELPAAT
jgi:PAS domain S-box-containing protein